MERGDLAPTLGGCAARHRGARQTLPIRHCRSASMPNIVEAADHLVLIMEHTIGDLLLKATLGVTIAVVSSRERKRRQPGLPTDDPTFVGWHQLVRGIQGS